MFSVLLYLYTDNHTLIAIDKPVDCFVDLKHWRNLKDDLRQIVEEMFYEPESQVTISYSQP